MRNEKTEKFYEGGYEKFISRIFMWSWKRKKMFKKQSELM